MPCYEAPPPYSQRADQSANDAVKILCSVCYKLIFKMRCVPDKEILEWYIGHRKIDLEIARDGRGPACDETVASIMRDIGKLETLYATQY